ncbi:RNA polymerase recycling motor HelD [Pontibacillus litoralis]|uniref:DNA helicase n=1 Tax=Pontibacillus litoralis JSM 072002 TaxID=1385512 RepID=A0A0A5HUN2_9BACI|nr:RNA polymerase recycling motor HelD [Pontibacillus litoralis]KGX87347.1 DNA helicase [Pontibacillus litoralis JSM 072002]
MRNHPDYMQEEERLIFTKVYMDTVIHAQQLDQQALQKRQTETVEALEFQDSSLKYQEMLTHSNFMRMSKQQLENLIRLRKKPYFARIDYQPKDKTDKTKEEIFYIGKVSLFDRETQQPVILDWRSPLANVYYEGRIGQVEYEAHGEIYEGYVSLKRQYSIEDGELLEFRDIDITTKDDLLQQSLSQSTDHRLNEIVATIQEEQNRVIRADLSKPIIVQGAAGSGKTTIALHRVSYFLYSLQHIFHPEQMLILAPNRLFINYMKEVLPELGVEKARSTTFADYVQLVTQHPFNVRSQHETLMDMLERPKEHRKLQMVAQIKGGSSFQQVLDCYIQRLEQAFCVEEDLKIADFRIKNGKKIKRMFLQDFTYLPFYQRKEKIRQILRKDVRQKQRLLLDKITQKYDDAVEDAIYSIRDQDKRKRRVTFLLEQKELKLQQIKKEAKSAVSNYMKKYPNDSLISIFKNLYQNNDTFHVVFSPFLQEDKRTVLQQHTSRGLRHNRIDAEDLATLLYLQAILFGVHNDYKAKKVVIDEAQDYSYMEFVSLKTALGTELFTIVGDLAQGIYQYRGLSSWEELLHNVFTKSNYLTLQKTYRTTMEIMGEANEILQQIDGDLPQAEPVVRHGEAPIFLSMLEEGWAERIMHVYASLQEEGFRTFAIIGKTKRECQLIYETLHPFFPKTLCILQEGKEMEQEKLVILPVYLSKGLEFDCVFLMNINEWYEDNELDLKLLYVAMTRPLHRLYYIGMDRQMFINAK